MDINNGNVSHSKKSKKVKVKKHDSHESDVNTDRIHMSS